MTTLQSIAASIAELPTTAEWQNGFDSIRAELRGLARPANRRPYRVSTGPRLAGYRLRAA